MATDEIRVEVSAPRPGNRTFDRLRRLPLIPMIIVGLVVFLALFANFISPHAPEEMSLANRLKPPFWQQGGSLSYMLGTDSMGRDLLSRLIFGVRVSLLVSMLALLLGAGIGTVLGLIAGYKGGWVDSLIMRSADATISMPIILLALLLAVTLGPSLTNVVIAIGVTLWARYARVIRGEVLKVRTQDYIAQARISGCSPFRIITFHIFPNVLNTLVVLLTLQVGYVILTEASLSFLGAGIPPPTPTWGNMVAEGREYITRAWWIALIPGISIILLVLAFNLLGDWLRDALDPKLRQM